MDVLEESVIRLLHRWPQSLALAAALMNAPLAAQEEPDTVFRIEPVLVRVLPSTIGMATPYPVSVIAGTELTRGVAPAFIEDVVRAVPGLQVQNRYNLAVGERFSIRGFGARSQFGVRGIRVVVDGIPATLPDGQATLDHLDLAGLGRVEVIRGPSSAAYGNAAGGVLHFQTLDPRLVPQAVTARSTVGSDGLWTVQANATGASGDTGYRVGVSRMTYDGFRTDPIADDGTVYGGGTRSIFNGSVDFPMAGGEMHLVANAVDLDARNPGSLPFDRIENEERGAWGFNIISGARKDVRQGQLGATWNRPVGENVLEMAGWGIRRELDNPIPGRVIDLSRNAGGFRGSLGGTADMRTGSFGWLFGAEAELQYDDRKNFDNDNGAPTDLILDQDERVRAFGIFGQGRLDFSASIAILAGLRYDDVRFTVADRFTAGGDPDDSGSRDMSSFNPSIGLVFKPGDAAEFFASASRAFETPTTTELANQSSGAGGFNPFLEPQTSVTLEVGFRFVPGPRFSLESSVFTTDVTSGLVPFEVPSDPGRIFYRNSGRSEYSGMEVTVDAELFPSATARLAYTRTNARYVSFRPEGVTYSGNRIPGIAPRSIDGVISYAPGLAFFELRGLWRQPIPVDDADTTRAPPFFLMDLSLGLDGYAVGDTRVSPFVRIDNVTGTYYIASVIPNAFGNRYFEPGPGRTFSVGLALGWGY